MNDTDKVEQVEKPAPESQDPIVDLDAETGADVPAAEDTEKVKSEDTEPKAEDTPESEAPAKDHDESSEEKRKRETGSARLRRQLAQATAELESLKRIAPKQDDETALKGLVDTEVGQVPKEADYSDYLAFQTALMAYETERRIVTRELRQKASQAQEALKAANEELIETFKERAEVTRKTLKDFNEVLQRATISPTHPEVVNLILSSEKGPELSYYLSKNPKVAQSLNDMSPMLAAREIGKLEQSASLATPNTVTKAPAPVEPIKGGTSPSSKFDPEKASYEEYKAKRASGWRG